ncbi:exopolysaccharide biosynthesis protein, glycosyltransferase [Aurantiacibacter atlanticus]|uniref:Exopolysaccharide biosynthesis protein, glycosyltransferase n=1 Tax=Aurantiacibacter atlanticus TaxID=1648404 RepID=A0A0H4V920_9SPHN|nr:glycosyltransferase [Aurantiacibacter atlanticus]AKQ41000.1 exopolysaccharide biosynthesis protein, glycosyltransferase [Aurantiacibacter atlanticus]
MAKKPHAERRNAPLLCLAASGGGHVRQLLDLEGFWSAYPHFFVTENTALGKSIAQQHDTEFVPHFALGQSRLGAGMRMLRGAVSSFWQSFWIIRRRRPEIVLTTGAGSQVFIVLWARLLSAKIILLDSFARFDRPSAFARMAGPLAHVRIAQSRKSQENWPGSLLSDPLRPIEVTETTKQDLVFATVGATLPFQRLCDLVLAAKRDGLISEDVILQVGDIETLPDAPAGVRLVRALDFAELQELLQQASIVICHGGTGSILTALRANCATIVIPRRFSLGEHYDDHQSEISEVFEQRDLVLSAHDGESLTAALQLARTMKIKPVTTDYSELIAGLHHYVQTGDPALQLSPQ